MTKVVLYAALMVGLFGLVALGIRAYGDSRYQAGVHDTRDAQEKAAAAQREKAQARAVAGDAGAQAATHAGAIAQTAVQTQTQTVVRTVTRYIHDSPSPVQCVMPDGDPVLRELAAAADRANTAAHRVSGARSQP